MPAAGIWNSSAAHESDEDLLAHHRREDPVSRLRTLAGRQWWQNRRFLTKVALVIGCFGLFTALALNISTIYGPTSQSTHPGGSQNDTTTSPTNLISQCKENPGEWDPSTVLNGPPTDKFRDNLRQNGKYITTWISAGWTNDVMTFINLIYLGIITERIPIIATFIPSHVHSASPIPFGEVFDVPRLRKELRMPVLEWSEVKKTESKEVDELGCWNTWAASRNDGEDARHSYITELLSLDVSYTRAPDWIKMEPTNKNEPFQSFWALASLAYPDVKKQYAGDPVESERFHLKLPPDDQLLCYDYLYYVGAQVPFEYEQDLSPAWRFVGKHLHWTPRLDDIVDQYVRKTLSVSDGEKTPTWIGIHIRHGDFKNMCRDQSPDGCFAPLPVISRRVEEVKQELLTTKGITVDHVIMTSDEDDQAWWDRVKGLGWSRVDHSETAEKYGPWYPVLIDAAIQAGGMGFVGTDGSTMSILARRRVQSWHDGAVRTVKWGVPGADDH